MWWRKKRIKTVIKLILNKYTPPSKECSDFSYLFPVDRAHARSWNAPSLLPRFVTIPPLSWSSGGWVRAQTLSLDRAVVLYATLVRLRNRETWWFAFPMDQFMDRYRWLTCAPKGVDECRVFLVMVVKWLFCFLKKVIYRCILLVILVY